jgi:hypothetical protein
MRECLLALPGLLQLEVQCKDVTSLPLSDGPDCLLVARLIQTETADSERLRQPVI